jgi:hypothetical protein
VQQVSGRTPVSGNCQKYQSRGYLQLRDAGLKDYNPGSEFSSSYRSKTSGSQPGETKRLARIACLRARIKSLPIRGFQT